MPLSKQQIVEIATNIDKAEAGIKDVTADIAQAKRAGIDVADQEKELATMRKMIRGIKNVYKPV